MANETETKETPKEEANTETINLLKEISAKVNAPKDAPASQPASDPMKVYNDRKADIMKRMNWNEDQYAFHEQEKLSAAAPLMKDMALLKVEKANKDYDRLKEPFEKEIKRYETDMRRVITPELAEEIFYMVKGKELSAGRYKADAPSSQPPARKDKPSGETRPRISSGYQEPSTIEKEDSSGGDSPQLTEREMEYVKIFGKRLLPEQYVKMREEKKQGIRAIADKAFRAPDIDIKSANPADRALAAHWGANEGELL